MHQLVLYSEVPLYLPSDSEFLSTLAELEGFIESQHCDFTLVAGDFNVDFDRGGPLASLLVQWRAHGPSTISLRMRAECRPLDRMIG